MLIALVMSIIGTITFILAFSLEDKEIEIPINNYGEANFELLIIIFFAIPGICFLYRHLTTKFHHFEL